MRDTHSAGDVLSSGIVVMSGESSVAVVGANPRARSIDEPGWIRARLWTVPLKLGPHVSDTFVKLYVGNLPYSVTDASLGDLFSQFGSIQSAKVIMDKFTGKSKGFGFVELDSSSAGEQAIEQLNGTEFEGRSIVVNEARPQPPREPREPRRDFGGPPRGGRGGGHGGGGGGGGRGGNRGGGGDRW